MGIGQLSVAARLVKRGVVTVRLDQGAPDRTNPLGRFCGIGTGVPSFTAGMSIWTHGRASPYSMKRKTVASRLKMSASDGRLGAPGRTTP